MILISGSLFSEKLMAPNQGYFPQDFKAPCINQVFAVSNKLNFRDLSICASPSSHITGSSEAGDPEVLKAAQNPQFLPFGFAVLSMLAFSCMFAASWLPDGCCRSRQHVSKSGRRTSCGLTFNQENQKYPGDLCLHPIGLMAAFNCKEDGGSNSFVFGWAHGCLNQSHSSINMNK